MKLLFNLFIGTLFCILISSCTSTFESRNQSVDSFTKSKGFTRKVVKGGDFWLTTFQHIENPHLPYVFYIEGDGYAFTRHGQAISDNPTPISHMLLNLATLDNRPNVVYIARPCQYTPMELNPKCHSIYWTNKRMSAEVVQSINDVINSISHNQPISLIGFSGGGGIAVLIAAGNKRVTDIITIAGNLDHKSFTDHHHKVVPRPMTGSLNPIEYASQIGNIPQLHLSGANDKIVPTFIAENFINASASPCVKLKVFPEFSHQKGWEKIWKSVLSIPLTCESYLR